MSTPDPIAQALDASRLALDFVRPAEASVTARINEQLTHNAIASLERGLAFLAFEKARQERVAAQRRAKADVDKSFETAGKPAPSAAKRK